MSRFDVSPQQVSGAEGFPAPLAVGSKLRVFGQVALRGEANAAFLTRVYFLPPTVDDFDVFREFVRPAETFGAKSARLSRPKVALQMSIDIKVRTAEVAGVFNALVSSLDVPPHVVLASEDFRTNRTPIFPSHRGSSSRCGRVRFHGENDEERARRSLINTRSAARRHRQPIGG